MLNPTNILLLLVLFTLLGLAAALVVDSIKYIAGALKMRLFGLGVVLGAITTLPELSVGINASAEGVAAVSVGNILGGIMVIMGLILSANVVLNRKIINDGGLKTVIPQALLMGLPLLLGLDGRYGLLDGLLMMVMYGGLIYYLYRIHHAFGDNKTIVLIERNKIIKAIFLSLAGIAVILLTAHWIVAVTVTILENTHLSKLIIGLLIFSVGTNLPEIAVAFTSWRKKASELSISFLVSSACTNIFILGLLAVLQPIHFTVAQPFYYLAVFIIITLILYTVFHHTKRKLERAEGFVLLLVYFLFLAANIFLVQQP